MLLAKVESSYGADPTPVGASNLIAVTRAGAQFSPNFTHLTRQILDGTLSKVSGANVLPEVSLSFAVEIRGNRKDDEATDTDISSGAAAQAIEIDALLRACDLAATYTAEGTNGARDGYVTYKPTVPTDEGTSVTFYYYTGSKLHKLHACKGTVKGNLTAGQMGQLDFEFKGVYADVCDAALPAAGNWVQTATIVAAGSGYAVGNVLTIAGGTASTAATLRVTSITPSGAVRGVKILQVGLYSVNPTLTANAVTGGGGSAATITITMATNSVGVFLNTVPPIFVNSGTTVGGYSPVFNKIDFDLGNALSKREDANAATGVRGFMVTGRDAKATIDPESVAETSHPIWGDLSEATARTITAAVGSLAGNRFQLTLAGVSQAVKYGDRSGIRTQEIDYSIERANLSDSAGAEWQMKFY